jgi:hypothetical protein
VSGSGDRRRFITGLAAGAAAGLPAGMAALGGEALASAASGPRGASPGDVPGGIADVTRFGAVGDGRTSCTRAIQRAIDSRAAAGGGLVLVPPGQYLTGALFLRSNIHLHVAAGATLLASPSFADFPPIRGRWEGVERETYSSLLTGLDLENVIITGYGALEGQGEPWWEADRVTRALRVDKQLPREAPNPAGAPLRWPRPRLINLVRCQGVVVSGLMIHDSPSYNLHFIYCQDVLIDGVTVLSLKSVNGDGIVVDSCKQVRIVSCSLNTAFDCISLKAGYNEDGRRVGIPCEGVAISNCTVAMSRRDGLAIGSETAGGIRNVTISNCVISNCQVGVHIRSPRGRGGGIERVRGSGLVIEKMSEAALVMTNLFDNETDASARVPVGEGTPTLRDFAFGGLTLSEVGAVAIIEGLPERFLSRVRLSDISASAARAGVICRRVTDVRLSGLSLEGLEQPAVAARDAARLEVHRLACADPPAKRALVELENVSGAFVHGCDAPRAGRGLVKLVGAGNHEVTVAGNNAPAEKNAP